MNKMKMLICAALLALVELSSTAAMAQQAVIPNLTVNNALRRWTGLSTGSIFPAAVAVVDSSGNQINSFGGAGGTASNFGSAFPSEGTAIGCSDGTNMVACGTASNPIRTNPTGTTAQPVTGTFWQSTQPVSGPLTDAQLRATSLPVTAAQSGTWTVQPGNTANTTAWLVTGAGGTFPATQSGNWSARLQDGAGNAITSNTRGAERPLSVAIVDAIGTQITDFGGGGSSFANSADNVAVSITNGKAAAWLYVWDGTAWDRLYGDSTNGAFVNVKASVPLAVTGTFWQATQPVSVASVPSHDVTNAGTFAVQATLGAETTKVIGAVNQGTSPWVVNQTQINGAAHLAGNGITGIGSPRVTIASDNTPFSVNATLGAETTKVIGTVNQGTSPWVVGGTVTANLGTLGGAATATNQTTIIGHVDGLETAIADTNTKLDTLNANVTSPIPAGTAIIGALVANQSVNVAQTNGVTPLMGNGPTGTGSPRVTLSQDSASVPINVSTATTTELVALSGSTKIYVTSHNVIAGGTGNITFVYGTGTNCGTGTTSLTGPYPLTAQVGLAPGSGIGAILVVPAGNALCVTTSAAVQMSGSVSYLQF